MNKSQNLEVFELKSKKNKNSGIEDNMAICRTYSEVWQRGTSNLMSYLSHNDQHPLLLNMYICLYNEHEQNTNPCFFLSQTAHFNLDQFGSFSVI